MTCQQLGEPFSVLRLLSHLHPWPILQRLGDMRRGDGLRFGQIGDGASQLEHAMEGAGRELQAAGWRRWARRSTPV